MFKQIFLIFLISLSALAWGCGSSSSKTSSKVNDTDIKTDTNTDTSDSGQSNSEKVCYSYIAKEKIDSILKADMFIDDYKSDVGECDYTKSGLADSDVLKGTRVRITRSAGRDWYDKQKTFFTSENNIYPVQGIGDESFGKGYSTIYLLKGGNTWFVDLYTGDENLVPELTVFNKKYNDVNKKNYENHIKAITKELASAVADNN